MLNTIERATATPTNIKKNTGYISKTTISAGIKVTVHIPEKVNENTRRRKINKIYDILSPKNSL